MDRRRKITVGLLATVVVVAVGALAGSALAGNGPGSDGRGPDGAGPVTDDRAVVTRPADDPGVGGAAVGDARQRMDERRGYGPGDGTCLLPDGPGELTAEQADTLADVGRDHALASALYAAFAERYGTRIFERVAAAEAQQWDTLAFLMERYGMDGATVDPAGGEFPDGATQARYEDLLAQGSADLTAALRVRRGLEQSQVADLEAALEATNPADVVTVYEHLLAASQQQLSAFEIWLDR